MGKIIDSNRFHEYRTENGYWREREPAGWRIGQKTSSVKARQIKKRNKVRNLIIILLMVIAFCSGFFGHSLLINAHAEERENSFSNRYYTSVQLKKGDSLWSIARNYSEGTDFNTLEYMEELKRLNRLESENIHAGEYLTIVYFD